MAEEQENELVPEEEVTSIPGWAPTVSLQVQDIRTGEEEEEEVYSQRSKLYRFKDGDWKERGLGDSKLLRHKVSGKVRYMMRQEKTGKIVANHFVFEHQLYCVLANQNQSDKILMWTALDYAEDEQHAEQFALKFKDKELAEMFRTAFDRAKVGQTSGSPKADGPGPPPSEPHSEPHGSPTPPAQAAAEGVEDELVPEEEVTVVPGWAPTVTLQPQEIRTGEEDEDEIYSQRSKLYRFKDSDWKERGLGDSKLLRNRVTGKVRYMMRQEKTGKIVANHYLIAYPPYCELAPNAGSDKIWTWTTIDCAEDEQKVEQFSLRFKDADLAQQFKTAFNSARAEMAEVYTPEPKTNDSEAAAGDAAAVGVSPESDAGENGNPFAGVSLFAASPLQSSGTALTGGATSGGLFSSLSSTGSVASSSGLFSTTAATSGGSLFSSSSASASSGLFGGGLFASANTAGGLFSGMSFGSNKADPPESQAQVESKPTSSEAAAPFASLTFAASTGGLFGNTAGSFFSGSGSLFGNSGNSSSSGGGLFSGSTGGASGGLFAGLPESSSGGIFGGGSIATTGSSLFGLAASSGSLFSAASGGGIQGAAATGAAEKAPSTGLWAGATANGAQDDEQYVFEEEVTQIPGWAPSVSLEVRDHVETGEEDEEEMYSQRSKLLRFVENEWKERGTGDAKILRHGGTGKCRFLMRQEKTAKIVANHYIIDQHPYCDLVHNAGNAKIWVWTALDWADEEQKVEKFALRFKTEELADEFAKAFNAAKSSFLSSKLTELPRQDDDDWEKAWNRSKYSTGTSVQHDEPDLGAQVEAAPHRAMAMAENGWQLVSLAALWLAIFAVACELFSCEVLDFEWRLLPYCGWQAISLSTPSPSAEEAGSPKSACKRYLQAKGFESAEGLAKKLRRCEAETSRSLAPRPEADLPGVSDTTNLQCQYVSSLNARSSCCGWRPHFNWVVGTCEKNSRIPNASFCDGVPDCAREPKINYAAAYQFNGSHFVLQDSSTAGELSEAGVSGSHAARTGWESTKARFRWEGGEGDWPTKYAPWGLGDSGPRGLTPPAALWVLSADSFYYGTLYMLSQLTLNTQGVGEHANCWEWEFDAIEGLIGTVPRGHPLPGNINQLYVTATAQVSGCMPMPGTAAQDNGYARQFSQPQNFQSFCEQNPLAVGCRPWTAEGADIWHGGGYRGTDRFENAENTPYVFAVVLDHQGFWVYRWKPDEDTGETGWPGISRTSAKRILPTRPRRISEPSGLQTNVKSDTREAVILIPSLPPEASCMRSLPEQVDWRWGAAALGSMAYEAGEYKLGEKLQGAQNWWAHFADTGQLQEYPLSIAGVPSTETEGTRACDRRDNFGKTCRCVDAAHQAEAEAYGAGALGEGPGDLAALAAMQATSGWRCDGCRLQWSEQDLECNVCEIVRPGYESEVAAAKAEKESGKQSAVAAFLGATQILGREMYRGECPHVMAGSSESCAMRRRGAAESFDLWSQSLFILDIRWQHFYVRRFLRVQEHLKDAIHGTLKLKRLLSEDEDAFQNKGGSIKKRKTVERCGPAEQANVTHLLTKWGAEDDVLLRHVLEGLKLEELEALNSSGYLPDKFNAWKSCADLTAMHIAGMRERNTAGGGALDAISAFRFNWKLDGTTDPILRKLCHKDLRYVLTRYDGSKDLPALIQEAVDSDPDLASAEGAAVRAPGCTAVGRFHRLELIDPTADSAVFGDANLSFALNLARHRKASA
ncbi:Nup358 [Symbiodinium sp. CCMP2592]|nr:Nup358 [Symbiodinium sp. CCMP2592]